MNVQTHEWSLPLSEVETAKATRTLGIVPNGLRIVAGARVDSFVVEGNRNWVTAITNAKQAAGHQG